MTLPGRERSVILHCLATLSFQDSAADSVFNAISMLSNETQVIRSMHAIHSIGFLYF